MKSLFGIRRDERLLALLAILFFVALNALVVAKYYGLFTPVSDNKWQLFVHNFHLSGFDPITYAVLTKWTAGYNVYRHPLLALFMFLPYLLNCGLTWITGINCALFIVAAINVFCSLYALLFIHRIFTEVIGLHRSEAGVLSALFFSFAYVLVSSIAPDHFIISMMLLLMVLYLTGLHLKKDQPMPLAETIVCFFLTAGVSLNNGLKVFLAALFSNGRKFFRPRFFLLAVLLPAALIWIIGKTEYAQLVWPKEQAANKERKAKAEAKQKKEFQMQLKQGVDSATIIAKQKKQRLVSHRLKKLGKPIEPNGFLSWTDISTSRWQSAVENLFGESIQLHRDHLLEDTLRNRPIIVHYKHAWHYVLEAFIVLLFLGGIWAGRRNKFLWLSLSFFGLDLIIHLGLGFGLNEVYIMTAHWTYVIPIAIAFLLKALAPLPRRCLTILLAVMALGLWVWNIPLIVKFLS